jgi:hypothetical protein
MDSGQLITQILAAMLQQRPGGQGFATAGWPHEQKGWAAQHEEKAMADADITRRQILAKAAYMAPGIVTLPVLLSFASAGSGYDGTHGDHGNHKGWAIGKHHGWENGQNQ